MDVPANRDSDAMGKKCPYIKIHALHQRTNFILTHLIDVVSKWIFADYKMQIKEKKISQQIMSDNQRRKITILQRQQTRQIRFSIIALLHRLIGE